MLIEQYRDRYVAYNDRGLLAVGDRLLETCEMAERSGEDFAIYLVPKHTAFRQILSIWFSNVSPSQWQPNYHVILRSPHQEMTATMLVDSGAELSLISWKLGRELGLNIAESETSLKAQTIGGTVEYVTRNLEMTIDDRTFVAPVAWLQSDVGGDQLLLGREVVFDKFNIEFRQADKQIIFTWRGE